MTSGSGFALVEVLVALVVLAIMAAVVLECHVLALKMEHGARVSRLLCEEVGRTVVADHLGSKASMGQVPSSCTSLWQQVEIEAEGGPVTLRECRLSSPDRPSLQAALYFFPLPGSP